MQTKLNHEKGQKRSSFLILCLTEKAKGSIRWHCFLPGPSSWTSIFLLGSWEAAAPIPELLVIHDNTQQEVRP